MTEYDVTVEIYVDDAWLDITRLDENTHVIGDVTITRGASDQQGEPVPTTVEFRYLDNLMTLDGENPRSAYYRKISVPGTPLRVKLDGEIRASVEITAMSIEPGEKPTINYVNVTATGLLDTLDEGQKPLKTALFRSILASNPKSFWPLNEGSEATQFSSGLPGGTPLVNNGVTPGAIEGPTGERFPNIAGGEDFVSAVGSVASNISATGWAVEFMFYIGERNQPEEQISQIALIWYIGDKTWRAQIGYNPFNATPPNLLIAERGGSPFLSDNDTALNGWNYALVTYEQVGADVQMELYLNGANVSSYTDVGKTLSAPNSQVIVGQVEPPLIFEFTFQDASVGMLAFYDLADAVDHSDAAFGYLAEAAGARMVRLAAEEGIALSVEGDADDTEPLGAQTADTFLGLLKEGAEVDLGILTESRTALELRYRTRVSLYSQAVTAPLDFAHLMPGFRPTADNLRLVNDITVTRRDGSSGQYAIPDGDHWHWSTEQPPDGAGVRDGGTPSLALATDAQILPQAGWRAHLGSWREKRFPTVTFQIAKPVFETADVTAVRLLDLGDLLVLDMTGAPAYVPYDELRLMVQGYTEVLSRKLHTLTLNTTPADIYEVQSVDADGSALAAPMTDVATSAKIAPPTIGYAWTEDANDLPFHIKINGDPMTVTALASDTPAFIAAGVVAHGNNASVVPSLPAGITAGVGQLLLIFAAIRNSGTGTVNTPTGWTTIVDFGNCRLMGRHYVSGDTAPTVTFTGGVANADTTAQMAAFSGLSMVIGSGTRLVPAAATLLNASAQNIATPAIDVQWNGGVLLFLGWKQDDWTSVALAATTPAPDAEIGEPDTTTGDDHGIVWDYDITTANTDRAATATGFAVTGGASAISRSALVSLRPLQTATVTRNIAGVAIAHSVGEEVRGWRMGVNAL